jgi:hypothetical protein
VQPEKSAQGLATLDLAMLRAKVEHRDGAGVKSDHDLLVGNGGVSTPRRDEGWGTG